MKIVKWPVIYAVVQFCLILIWGLLFSFNHDISDFGTFLNENYIYLVLIIGLIFIPLLSKNYKQKEKKIELKTIVICIIVGIILSIIYNTIVYYFNTFSHFTDLYSGKTNILYSIIGTGLIGPIIEELMFRGIIYNELKNKYPVMKSILITTIFFALIHANFVQIIYAFALGFILIYAYELTNNLKSSILIHMASNITTTFISLLLQTDNFILCMTLFIISLGSLIIIYIKSIPFLKEINVGIFKNRKKCYNNNGELNEHK